ncbi:hypothetical protein M7I_5833 [Glarea lozoyensis 74030]|uniref:Uncharacterized protein n=1 Tax=Glarea lozoyensis (strain ATCC 74030 / MF5533) TaxID=1104152 RepID=H0ESW1_GLAL7|nr:hypothetical protein M7I_5833 [Glarea lozoyensis 74030]
MEVYSEKYKCSVSEALQSTTIYYTSPPKPTIFFPLFSGDHGLQSQDWPLAQLQQER